MSNIRIVTDSTADLAPELVERYGIKVVPLEVLVNGKVYLFMASSMATATETVAPTMGLLPMPMRPIISTWAGTEEEPAN